ncbi:MAG: selenium-dependent xanthine dehydrogenase [Chloroflexota bacterium]
MRFILNGRSLNIHPRPGASVLELLREDCGLRSMKDGCAPEGSCGACTVMVDGRAVVSCAQQATRVAGRTILTLEGLPPDARGAWARAFIDSGASQCGFCSPGIVMKAEALLRRVARPAREEIARALAGNLCRCTGYVKVIDAIEAVADARATGGGPAAASGESGALVAAAPGNGVGARAGRYDGAAYVLGEHQYVADMTVPGMLHGAIRFADHPRAVVRSIDLSRAASLPGVVAVVTWRDVPGERVQGLLIRDWPLLVAEGETTRFVGDALAAVAATTRAAAREAASLIEIDYDVLAPVADPASALADGAPLVHPGGNLLSSCVIRRGEIETALAVAAHVATETFETQRLEHAFLEPEAALAVPGDVGQAEPAMRVFSQGQGAWEDRRQVASILGLPETAVRVTQVATGGAFGGKEDLGAQGHAALLAHVTGRPVLVALSRQESLRFHPKRHPLSMTYTVACDGDGRLVGVKARIVGDTGAYASVGAKVLERAAGHACGAYRVPNVDVEALTVYTNNTPCGAMRGFGVPQVTFAIESLLDDLAERVGIDRWEMRWRNALDTGDRTGTGQLLGPGVGLKQTLLAVRAAFDTARHAGIACGMKNTGIGNGVAERGRAILRPEADGTVTLFHSWTEMGQGIHTALRQIACEELGLAADRMRVVVDTEVELDTGETTASRATVLGGMAVLDAARRLREALGSGRLEELAGREFPGEFLVDWTTAPEGPDSEPVTHFAYGWATQVVVLDEDGCIERVVAAQDVGRAINPLILEGQMEGGVHMGLGYALSEAYELADGVPVTESLKSLGIIPAANMPPVECILIEAPQPEGPFGAKGAGEAVLVPTAAAVAGALHAFDGIRRTRLPMRDSAAARAVNPRLAHRSEAAVAVPHGPVATVAPG